MQQIIICLLVIIQYQSQIINYLCVLLFGRNYKPKSEKCTDKKYLKLSVDPLPLFGKPKTEKIYDCNELIKTKGIKPVKRRSGKSVCTDVSCPYCGASHEYLYDNTGGRGQFECKVCGSLFNPSKPSKDDEPYCPFCHSKLVLVKKRKSFDIYRCNHIVCSYRKKKLSAMTSEQKALFKKSAHIFKLRFIYRKFHFKFTPLSKDNAFSLKVDLPNITASHHVLGLILTYHINYGIPLRKTAALMFDVHNVKVSHQTIANYCNAVAPRVKPFIDGFSYELSDSFCGDETYVKVNGRWHYIFFFFDAVKKIILSYRVQRYRDYQSAVLAINDVLAKLRQIPEKLNLITDGNPIYLLAQQFFAGYGINFDVSQVIGLTNQDDVSKEFRPLKQIIERLNRTFKGNYKPTAGYSSDSGAISNVTLFVAYFNFLRPHSSLDGNVPALIPELDKLPNMPAKWLKLISLSENFIKSRQAV
jgi:transposase-like protein/rubredoxin